jgi:hypothetical protein
MVGHWRKPHKVIFVLVVRANGHGDVCQGWHIDLLGDPDRSLAVVVASPDGQTPPD